MNFQGYDADDGDAFNALELPQRQNREQVSGACCPGLHLWTVPWRRLEAPTRAVSRVAAQISSCRKACNPHAIAALCWMVARVHREPRSLSTATISHISLFASFIKADLQIDLPFPGSPIQCCNFPQLDAHIRSRTPSRRRPAEKFSGCQPRDSVRTSGAGRVQLAHARPSRSASSHAGSTIWFPAPKLSNFHRKQRMSTREWAVRSTRVTPSGGAIALSSLFKNV